MYSFIMGAKGLTLKLDELIDERLPGAGWELASHDVSIVGEKTLTTLIFRRPIDF
jgi:glutamine cyclotransferase